MCECEYVCSCVNWYVPDRSVSNYTVRWDNVDENCCVGVHVKFDTFRSNLLCLSSGFQINQAVVWLPSHRGWMPYSRDFVERDDIDWWLLRFLRVVFIVDGLPGCSCL